YVQAMVQASLVSAKVSSLGPPSRFNQNIRKRERLKSSSRDHWIVTKLQAGMRFDVFVSQYALACSRGEARRRIGGGEFWINGRPSKKLSRAMWAGDRVSLVLSRGTERNRNETASRGTLTESDGNNVDFSVYEGEPQFVHCERHFAILNKPSGLLVEPSPHEDLRTCLRQLEAWQRAQGVHPKKAYVSMVHRLDRGASGALAVAFSRSAAKSLATQFAERSAKRIYWAVVEGHPSFQEMVLKDSMDRVGPGLRRGVVKPPRGKHAHTHVRVLEAVGPGSLVEVQIFTGRTHQIRVHMAHVGHPLLGDPLYGARESIAPRCPRLMLHAQQLSLRHPQTQQLLSVSVPLPEDFEQVCTHLRRV
ncbi:MAG: RluA family pseudouridine synthase, partial [Myxococcota bacterium]